MPTALPGISITKATQILQQQDALLKQFPEVERVFGKIGRAETSTDPAPLSMTETTVTLKPEDQWRPGMTWDKLIAEMDRVVRFPGMPNVWWMPIQTRTEMLATGVRSAVGIKIYGSDLAEIDRIGKEIEGLLSGIPGTRSAFSERVTGGYYLDFIVNRREAARYNLTVQEVQEIIEAAIGGVNVTTTVEGRERYTVNVRYARELRDDIERLKRVLVPTPTGAHIPLEQLAEIRVTTGPSMIRDENGSLAGIVYVDVVGRDLGSYVDEARRTIAEQVKLPPGYALGWAGSYEYLQRAKERLKIVVPLTLLLIFVLLYLNFRSVGETLIVLLSIPFAIVGSILFLALLGYHLSIAVWVGIIALAGVAAETGVVMIIYLDEAFHRYRKEGRLRTKVDLVDAVMEGAVLRVRPKVMTVSAIIFGLLPIMWSHGAGADVMKRIAAPMIGGMITSTILTLIVIPVIYVIWREWEARRART
jgi:Cu(I)/Ag(I) efflux system membrane protein CusA/SilA